MTHAVRAFFTKEKIERLAELMAVNGGTLAVHGWGISQSMPKDDPYGRRGLMRDEALELIELSGVLIGIDLTCPSDMREIGQELIAVWERKTQEAKENV